MSKKAKAKETKKLAKEAEKLKRETEVLNDSETKVIKKDLEKKESFGYTKEDIPEITKSFFIHTSYTFRKLINRKKLWIGTLIISLMFLFTWRGQSGSPPPEESLPEASYLNAIIFSILVLFILPMVSAYFIAKSYSDEKEKGDILFMITKSDSKFLVYFSKYVGVVLASWFWIFCLFIASMVWVLIKTLFVLGGNETMILIFGSNPPPIELGYYFSFGLSSVAISVFIILFWSALFFLLARVLGTRGVILSASIPILAALVLPIIGQLISGFGVAWDVYDIETGEYQYYETTSEHITDSRHNPAAGSLHCRIELENPDNLLVPQSSSDYDSLFDSDSLIQDNDNSINSDPIFSTWDRVEINKDSKMMSEIDFVKVDIDNLNQSSFGQACLAGVSGNENWQEPRANWDSEYDVSLDWSSDSDDYVIEYAAPIDGGHTFTGTPTYGYMLEEHIDEDNGSITYSYSSMEEISYIDDYNKTGWLSFLNPMYYSAVLLEQPLRIITNFDGNQSPNEFSNKILSNIFGGNHHAIIKYNEIIEVDSYVTGIRNSENSLLNNPHWIEPLHTSSDNMGVYTDPSNTSGNVQIELDLHIDDYDYSIRIPVLYVQNVGTLTYEGVEYWINPAGTVTMFIIGGLFLSAIAIYVNSKSDVGR